MSDLVANTTKETTETFVVSEQEVKEVPPKVADEITDTNEPTLPAVAAVHTNGSGKKEGENNVNKVDHAKEDDDFEAHDVEDNNDEGGRDDDKKITVTRFYR